MQPHKKNQWGNSRREQRVDDIKARELLIKWGIDGEGFRALSGEIIIYTVPNPYRTDNAKRSKVRRIKPLHRTNEED